MKNFLRKYIWLFLIIILIMLFPQSLSTQASLNMRMIISGVGIDYVDDLYEITAQVILPKGKTENSSINANIQFVSAKELSISKSIESLSCKFGKSAELSHLEYVLIGDGFENKNIVSELDYFFRNFKLKNSIMLLATDQKSAKETIKNVGKLDMGVALSLQKVFISGEENLTDVAKTYIDYSSESFSLAGTSSIGTLAFEDAEEQSEQGAQQNAKIKVNSPIMLYKNGIFASKIEKTEYLFAFSVVQPKAKAGNLQLHNFSFGDVQNSNINIRMDKIKTSKKVEFDSSGLPIFNVSIKIVEAHIDELASTFMNKNLYKFAMDKELQTAIIDSAKEKIKSSVYALFEKMKTEGYDIMQVANFATYSSKEKWSKYISQLADEQNYLENISINVNVSFDIIR